MDIRQYSVVERGKYWRIWRLRDASPTSWPYIFNKEGSSYCSSLQPVVGWLWSQNCNLSRLNGFLIFASELAVAQIVCFGVMYVVVYDRWKLMLARQPYANLALNAAETWLHLQHLQRVCQPAKISSWLSNVLLVGNQGLKIRPILHTRVSRPRDLSWPDSCSFNIMQRLFVCERPSRVYSPCAEKQTTSKISCLFVVV